MEKYPWVARGIKKDLVQAPQQYIPNRIFQSQGEEGRGERLLRLFTFG